MDSVIRSYQREDHVELDEVLAKAKELAACYQVLSIEHNMISVDVRDPKTGWWITKSVPGYQIVVDTTGKATGKFPQVRDILALCGKHG